MEEKIMTKYVGIKEAAQESGIAEYTLRQLCKRKKIRYNLAGNTKYILRLDWLEEDLEKMALENINSFEDVSQFGKLRRIES
jgi:predicted site-specific integrase-resolvase